jgi:hypothetical protein
MAGPAYPPFLVPNAAVCKLNLGSVLGKLAVAGRDVNAEPAEQVSISILSTTGLDHTRRRERGEFAENSQRRGISSAD